MKISKELYDTMTAEQLEENIEFIDWNEFPIELITDEFKNKFSNFPKIKARIWFEEILSSLETKIDEKKFGNRIFFFRGNELLFECGINHTTIYCSHEKIWLFLSKECFFSTVEITVFLIFMLNNKYKGSKYFPAWAKWNFEFKNKIEQHFNKLN